MAMAMELSNRQRASLVGVLMITAYAMLTYTLTNNAGLGVVTDILSGLAVIGIPILMFPIFNGNETKATNYAYMAARFTEGALMIAGGIIIMIPSLESYRAVLYETVHVYFFIAGALLFYVLLYRTQAVPRYISIWGFIATLLLLTSIIIQLLGGETTLMLALLVAPIILNELFLVGWLVIKGFSSAAVEKRRARAAA